VQQLLKYWQTQASTPMSVQPAPACAVQQLLLLPAEPPLPVVPPLPLVPPVPVQPPQKELAYVVQVVDHELEQQVGESAQTQL
jgi:hypothetical protein